MTCQATGPPVPRQQQRAVALIAPAVMMSDTMLQLAGLKHAPPHQRFAPARLPVCRTTAR
jgi:hypothetical protein